MSDGNFEGQEVLTEQISTKVGVEKHPEKIPDQAFELFRNTDLVKKDKGSRMLKDYFFMRYTGQDNISEAIAMDGDLIYKELLQDLGQFVPDMEDMEKRLYYSGRDEALDNIGTRLVDNLRVVQILEQQRPGIAKVLRNEFGIRNFFRYPPEVLIAQFDNRGVVMKRGIVVTALDDHLGSMYKQSSKDIMLKLFNDLQDQSLAGDKYGIVIYEVEDSKDLVRKIAHARHMVPNKQFSFGFIKTHGSENAFNLSRHAYNNIHATLTSDDVMSSLGSSVAGAFEEGSSIIFESCSAAKGMVPKASSLGLRVSGPEGRDSLRSISVSNSGGKLVVDGEWHGKKATYLNGVKL